LNFTLGRWLNGKLPEDGKADSLLHSQLPLHSATINQANILRTYRRLNMPENSSCHGG
jgi:hypothetical protein